VLKSAAIGSYENGGELKFPVCDFFSVCMNVTEASSAGVSVCAQTRRARQRQNASWGESPTQSLKNATSESGGKQLEFP